jgi:hypothetical protein
MLHLMIAAALALPVPPQAAPEKAPAAPKGETAAAAPAAVAPPPDEIALAGADAGAVRTPSIDAAWGGIRTGAAERVADYDLSATLNPERHTVDGHERLTWQNRSDQAVRSLYFHLYLNAFESSGSTFFTEMVRYGGFRSGVKTKKGEYGFIELKAVSQEGNALRWSFVHPDGGPATDHTVVRVDLKAPVPPHGTAVLEFDFHDQLPRLVARTGYFDKFHLVAQWFPKLGVLELPGERGATAPRWNCHELHLFSEFYADFGNYRAQIALPKNYRFGSVGRETEPPRETPQGTVHTVAQDDVHDFAFTAWDQFAPPLEGTARDGRVKVITLYPPEMAEAGRVSQQATIDAIEYFSKTLGEYPYSQVTCVVPPHNAGEAAGMEYETFFTGLGALPHETQFAAVRFVAVHEFGHGYFMGMLASNEFEEPFLDEGLNEFWDSRLMQPITLSAPLLDRLGLRTPPLRWFDLERLGGTRRFQADPIAGNSWQRWSSGSYGLVYARTALVFHDLGVRMDGPLATGDGTFIARAFREYFRRWHHRHPSTADFQKTLEDVASDRAPIVREWFEKQVFDRAPIDDRVEKLESTEVLPGKGLIEGREVDEASRDKAADDARDAFEKAHPGEKERGPFPFRTVVQVRRYGFGVPQTLIVKFADGTSETARFGAEERWHRYSFDKPVRAVSAQLDPDGGWLLDLNKLDDGRLREPLKLAARRWTLEASAWTQLLFSLVGAL